MNGGLHPGPDPQHVVVRDRLAVHPDPFVEADQMGRRVQADSVPRGPEGRGRVRTHGPFAVRPGHVEDLQVPVRIAEQGKQSANVVQAELDAEPLKPVQMVEGRLIVHRTRGG